MADCWNFAPGGITTTLGDSATASTTTLLSSGASNNVKGSWVSLGTTARNTKAALVCCKPGDAFSPADFLVDIGVGTAGGSEVAIFRDLYCGHSNSSNIECHYRYFFPCEIPSGTNISARCAVDQATDACSVQVVFLHGGFEYPVLGGCVEPMGIQTAHASVAIFTSGSSANTKNTYTEIAASTNRAYKGLVGVYGPLGYTFIGGADKMYTIDIAVGGTGSESVVIANMCVHQSGQGHASPNVFGPIPVDIPAGSRLSIREAHDLAGAQGSYGFGLYGIA